MNVDTVFLEHVTSEATELHNRCSRQEKVITDLWSDALTLKEKKIESARTHNLLNTLINTVPDFIFIKDTQSRFILNNQAHLRLLGAMDQSLTNGKNDFDFFPHNLAERYYADEQLILKTGSPMYDREERTVDRCGREWWLSTTKAPMRDDDGKIIGIIGISRDISHRKKAEEEKKALEDKLRKTEKIELVGELAAGFAHDFNNMICAISGHAQLLKHCAQSAHPELSRHIETIISATESAAHLTRKLLDVSRMDPIAVERLDLHTIIASVTRLLQTILPPTIALRIVLPSDALPILGNSAQLENMLINLALNARDAMPAGGCLIVTCDIEAVGEDHLLHRQLAKGNHIVISIRDTGVGMDTGTMAKLFQPFFTTKEKGKGTGLGLSSVYRTATGHGGTVAVESEIGKGTAFRVYLPVARA